MPWTARSTVLLAALFACTGESADTPHTLLIASGELGTSPVPTLTRGQTPNKDPASLLFSPLAALNENNNTSGDSAFVPMLADSWERRDSLTLAFHLDPRATWHDGQPVTAQDVVFTITRAKDPALSESSSGLADIVAVEAEGDRTVVFRYRRPFAEQLYAAVFHVSPLPSHLLAGISPDSLASSDFVQSPVGSGPYRFVELVPGQRMVLEAVPDFFLGAPAVDRVIIQLVSDPAARLNLLLAGGADASPHLSVADVPRIEADPRLQLYQSGRFRNEYLLFNQRDPSDGSRPHPILGDPRVRRALVLATDRQQVVDAVFQGISVVSHGPVSQPHWTFELAPPIPFDTSAAAAELRGAGWARDPEGRWQKDGRMLELSLSYPSPSRTRTEMAQIIQEQWRQFGVTLQLVPLEGQVWADRHNAGEFELSFGAANMDPTPSGVSQSWSCNGDSNVGHYCNPVFDSLVALAVFGQGDAAAHWAEAYRVVQQDAPAVFVSSPSSLVALDRRFGNVGFPPYAIWSSVWRWTIQPVPAG